MTKTMRSIARFLSLYAYVFLVPFLLGCVARWATYGFEGEYRLMFWLALAALLAGAGIRAVWKEPAQ